MGKSSRRAKRRRRHDTSEITLTPENYRLAEVGPHRSAGDFAAGVVEALGGGDHRPGGVVPDPVVGRAAVQLSPGDPLAEADRRLCYIAAGAIIRMRGCATRWCSFDLGNGHFVGASPWGTGRLGLGSRTVGRLRQVVSGPDVIPDRPVADEL